MGVRSDILIMTTKGGFEKLNALPNVASFIKENGVVNTYKKYFISISFSDIKWYGEDVIDTIQNFMDSYEEISYAIIGEEYEDTHYESYLGDLPMVEVKRDFEITD